MIIERMLKELEKFDPQGVFANPVTDDIAPGYFSIIRHPMDFSTIRKKLNKLEYLSLYSVRNDLELMCRNCTKYNTGTDRYINNTQKTGLNGKTGVSRP